VSVINLWIKPFELDPYLFRPELPVNSGFHCVAFFLPRSRSALHCLPVGNPATEGLPRHYALLNLYHV